MKKNLESKEENLSLLSDIMFDINNKCNYEDGDACILIQSLNQNTYPKYSGDTCIYKYVGNKKDCNWRTSKYEFIDNCV